MSEVAMHASFWTSVGPSRQRKSPTQVMLRVNLWTSAGLTNGAVGTFRELIAEGPNRTPLAALVHFPSYTGTLG